MLTELFPIRSTSLKRIVHSATLPPLRSARPLRR
jgi:hypothetical protein